jgi:uncharacterized protein involved in type VI secretion and phage assembly
MCCCGKPNVNGTPGAYSWDGRTFSTRQPTPPPLQEGDALLYDEPGRCGGIDAHSHHFRVVAGRYGLGHALLVRHGGGDERIRLGAAFRLFLPSLAALDSDARYWLLHSLYSAQDHAASEAREAEANRWGKAAAEKRIKVRKVRNSSYARVTIEPPPAPAVAA